MSRRDDRALEVTFLDIDADSFNNLANGGLSQSLTKAFGGQCRISPEGYNEDFGICSIGIDDPEKATDSAFVKQIFDHVAAELSQASAEASLVMARRADHFDPDAGLVNGRERSITDSATEILEAWPAFAKQNDMTPT